MGTAIFSSALATVILVLGAYAFAADESASDQKAKATSADTFRCESTRNLKLAELKGKLVENCDLDKPFAISESGTPGLESKSVYCCHTKK